MRINTSIKNTNPESPKTKPERGLFSRKDLGLGPVTPLGGGTAVEVVSVTVAGTPGWLVGNGGVSEGEG